MNLHKNSVDLCLCGDFVLISVSHSKRFQSKAIGYQQEGHDRQAIALGYDSSSDSAPKILATGKGEVAKQIISIAKTNGIPIKQDPVLNAALVNVDIGKEIPPELYLVVVEVLAFIYRIREATIR